MSDETLPERDRTSHPYAGGLDVEFDIDLGYLVQGHRVIARGLMIREVPAWMDHPATTQMSFEFDFVPGLTDDEAADNPFFWYWMLDAHDDVGTDYDSNNTGAFATDGGASSHGSRDLRVPPPANATRLTLVGTPAPGNDVPTVSFDVELATKTVVSINRS